MSGKTGLLHNAPIAAVAALLLTVGPAATSVRAQAHSALNWQPFEAAVAAARQQEKPVLVDVWAPWCGWCHRMKTKTYPALGEALAKRFILTRLNRDDNESSLQYRDQPFTPLRLAQKLGAGGVPAVIFLDPAGEKLLHVSGFLEARELRAVVEYVGSFAYRRTSSHSRVRNRTDGK